MNKKENRERWKNLANEYKASGKTARSWCKENNISTSTFRYWLKKYSNVSVEASNRNQWVSVRLDNSKIEESFKEKNTLTIKIGGGSHRSLSRI